ncbi:piggyBac transposable element-derived protein 4-like [Melitaea cinxia]|uniref:piggyBac transposable element-derived protein 4-like n=1 Tax=Melitaea cinxia TaxID=113334 RepID=UPI001E27116C|nr:piggyBac transposable element-derived protein 4-like [Melitaea cinxia]
MSRKQVITDEQLTRILEESDYEEEILSNSSDSVENLYDDDSVADPDFFPSESQFRTQASDVPALSNSDSSNSATSDAVNTSVQTPRNSAPRIFVSRSTTDYDMKRHDENEGWNYDIQPLHREDFTSDSFLHIDQIPENADVFTIFRLLVDDEILDLMVQQTNLYAEQSIAANPGGRWTRWKPVTREDIEKFMGIYLVTDNTAERNDRLYKVKPVIDIVMRNCRKLLTPKDVIVVDESMATTDDGYVWKYKVYTGQDPQISNLDKPGSVVVELCEELLDQGRMVIADNWYTSIPLAEYLLSRKTNLCGTLRKNRKHLPLLVKKKKLKSGQHIAAQRNNITILKWKDKRDILMISTYHADEQTMTTGRNARLKPNMILEYNNRKKGSDLSDELIPAPVVATPQQNSIAGTSRQSISPSPAQHFLQMLDKKDVSDVLETTSEHTTYGLWTDMEVSLQTVCGMWTMNL